MINLGHWRKSLGNRRIFMMSQNISLSLSVIGKGMIRPKDNGLRSGKDMKMQVRKKMWLLRILMRLRRDMDLILEISRIKVVIENHYSVGFVARIMVRRIVHCTNVANLKSIVLRRRKQLGMLVRAFFRFMQHLITSRKITRNPLLRWKVIFVINLFPF